MTNTTTALQALIEAYDNASKYGMRIHCLRPRDGNAFDTALHAARAALAAPAPALDAPAELPPTHVLQKAASALNGMLTFFGMDEDESSKPTFDAARRAWADIQFLLQANKDAYERRADMRWWDRLCALPRYSFLIADGLLRRVESKAGAWIELADAQAVVDGAQSEINVLRATRASQPTPAQDAGAMVPDDKALIELRDGLLPSQGEAFDTLAYGRAVRDATLLAERFAQCDLCGQKATRWLPAEVSEIPGHYCNGCGPAPQVAPTAAQPVTWQSPERFKAFHRSLCARFGYTHDEVYWWRDLVSLEEYIALKLAAQAPALVPLTEETKRKFFEAWDALDDNSRKLIADYYGITPTTKEQQ